MKMNRCAMVVGVMVIASSGRAQSLYQSNEAPAEQPPAVNAPAEIMPVAPPPTTPESMTRSP